MVLTSFDIRLGFCWLIVVLRVDCCLCYFEFVFSLCVSLLLFVFRFCCACLVMVVVDCVVFVV